MNHKFTFNIIPSVIKALKHAENFSLEFKCPIDSSVFFYDPT